MDVSRRSILKGGAAATLGLAASAFALAGCSKQEEGQKEPEKKSSIEWGREADVVILGTGAAGLASGISCSRAGLKTLVLEKACEEDMGGNSRVAGNIWSIPVDEEAGIEYITGCASRIEDQDTIAYLTAFAKAAAKLNDDFLIDMDMEIVPISIPGLNPEHQNFPHKPGCSQTYSANGSVGTSGLWNALKGAYDKCTNIETLFEAPGLRLITDEKGAVLGVVARIDGAEVNVKAKKGVILACGGYEFDQAMIENTFPVWPVFGRGTPYNTGDGLRMAQKVGAGTWHWNCTCTGVGLIKAPGLNFGHGAYDSDRICSALADDLVTPSWGRLAVIHVNKHGKRFMDECRGDNHSFGKREYLTWYDGVNPEFTNSPFWVVIDAAGAAWGAMGTSSNSDPDLDEPSRFGWFNVHSGYEWSMDNSEEVKRGWVLKGDTLADLAKQMGVDPTELEETVARYNGFAESGVDEDFGRPADGMEPLGEGPYYAVQVYPAMYNTQGGPKRNTNAQILDSFGEPIPGLYGCGECGAGFSWLYEGGWNLAECCVTGQWAAKDIASRAAWDE